MTVVKPETDGNLSWGEHFTLALQTHREKLAGQLDTERQRIMGAEQEFHASMQQLAEELVAAGDGKQREAGVLDTILQTLVSLQGEVQASRDATPCDTLELTAELQQARELLHDQVAEFKQARQEQEALSTASREQLQTIERDRQALTQASAALAIEESRIHESRRRIARALRARKAEQHAALEQLRMELLRRSASQDLELAPQLAAANDEIARLQAEVAERDAQFDALGDREQMLNADISKLRGELEKEREAAAGLRDQAAAEHVVDKEARDQLEAELEALRTRCQTLQRQVDQNVEIDHEFQQAQQAWETERQQLQAELQALEALQKELAYFQQGAGESDSHVASLGQQLSEVQALSLDEHDELVTQVETLLSQVADLEEERRELQPQALRAADLEAELEEARGNNTVLQEECDSLKRADTESTEHPAAAAEVARLQEELEDVRYQWELAIAEVQELKHENRDLQRDTAQPGSGHSTATSSGFDWEAQKQRLLNELETGMVGAGNAPASKEERLSVEGAIQLTEQVIAEKDQIIATLRCQVEAVAMTHSPPPEVQEPDLAEIFDHDELIRREREKLQGMQSEWREKLRQAELDVSVERAKLARERLAMEEQLQRWETEKQRLEDSNESVSQGKKHTGRWLSRLGLSKDEH